MTEQQLALLLPTVEAARQMLSRAANGHYYITSRDVAKCFGMWHGNVMRIIRKKRAISSNPSLWGLCNFAESSYLNRQGKRQPEYLISGNGFALLVVGLTGKDAQAWQECILEAFQELEAELQAVTARYAAALDMVRPNLRPVVEGTLEGLTRKQIGAPLGKSAASITYHRARARQYGLLPARQQLEGGAQ